MTSLYNHEVRERNLPSTVIGVLKMTCDTGSIKPSVYRELHDKKLAAETHPVETAQFLAMVFPKCYQPVQDNWPIIGVVRALIRRPETHETLRSVLDVMSAKGSGEALGLKTELDRIQRKDGTQS